MENFNKGRIENMHFVDDETGEITEEIRHEVNKHQCVCEEACVLCQGCSRA